MVKSRVKTDTFLLAGMLIAFLWLWATNKTSAHIDNFSSCIWVMVIVYWMLSLREEMVDRMTGSLLIGGGVLLIMLFILRLIRYLIVPPQTTLSRLCWYAYYIPICIIPVLSLALSLRSVKKNRRFIRALIAGSAVIAVILLLFMLTNDIHGLAIRIRYEGKRELSNPEILYYVIMAWSFLNILASYLIMLYRCSLTDVRKHWYLPAIVCGMGLVMAFVYYSNGGDSPRINGTALYMLQEIIVILFMGFWESCILIGLIPTMSMLRERDLIKNGIRETVTRQDEAMREIFNVMWGKDEEEFKRLLTDMGCLGAYIKRRANLELIADENGLLSTTELLFSIRESMEYYELAGVSAGVEESGRAEIPAILVTAAYEIFEQIMEAGRTACYVRLLTKVEDEVTFQMQIEADATGDEEQQKKESFWRSEFLRLLGAEVDGKVEDETLTLSISARYPIGLRGLLPLRLMQGRHMRISYGLSGLSRYYHLEKEALAEKIRIHDSLGRSLLMTKRYLQSPGTVGRDALMQEWSRSLFTKEASESYESREAFDKGISVCIGQADRMGIEVALTGALPCEPELRRIIDSAVTVQITNVLRHTSGHRVTIEAKEDEGSYMLYISNDGFAKDGRVEERGGLKNLRSQTEAVGGSMEIRDEDGFLLTLHLPKENAK